MSSHQNSWRISWSQKYYDYEGRIEAARQEPHHRIFWQSWGNRSLKSIENIKTNDIVYITCGGYCIAKGRVLVPFKQQMYSIISDPFSKNIKNDSRHDNNQFCQILLEEIPSREMRRKLPGNQMTFSQGSEFTTFLENAE